MIYDRYPAQATRYPYQQATWPPAPTPTQYQPSYGTQGGGGSQYGAGYSSNLTQLVTALQHVMGSGSWQSIPTNSPQFFNSFLTRLSETLSQNLGGGGYAPPTSQPAPPYGQPAPPYGQPTPQPTPPATPPYGGIPGMGTPRPTPTTVEGMNNELRQAMVSVAESNPYGLGVWTTNRIANTLGPNPLWQNTGNTMQVRPGVRPSDAVQHLFANPKHYTHECSSSVVALSLKAQLDVLGPEKFNQIYANGLSLDAWNGAAIRGSETFRGAQNGQFNIGGVSTVAGDLAPFDFNAGDRLIPGDIYYFDKAGDASSYYQGWNTVYLGQEMTGRHRFWTMEGIESFHLGMNNGVLMPVENYGLLAGHYLGATRTDPNGAYFL